MKHTSYIPTAPIRGTPARDPYARLAIEIIELAKSDFRKPKERNSAYMFFCSDWYKDLFDYITLCVPSFDPDEYILPSGVSLGVKEV